MIVHVYFTRLTAAGVKSVYLDSDFRYPEAPADGDILVCNDNTLVWVGQEPPKNAQPGDVWMQT